MYKIFNLYLGLYMSKNILKKSIYSIIFFKKNLFDPQQSEFK